jgi:hypothetical protein
MQTSRGQLIELLNTLKRAEALINTLIAESTSDTDTAPENWRRRPGGQLNELGEAEIDRRFKAGHSDTDIASAMKISLTGVAKRHTQWRRSQKQV